MFVDENKKLGPPGVEGLNIFEFQECILASTLFHFFYALGLQEKTDIIRDFLWRACLCCVGCLGFSYFNKDKYEV